LAILTGILYQLVLNGFLRANTAGLISDVPGQLGILYGVLRLRYRHEPWAALGWIPPVTWIYWAIAALGGISLGAVVMAVENPNRLRIHFHDIGYALVFGGLLAPLVEETIFRGMILPIVLHYLRPLPASVVTGMLFALYHALYKGMPPPDILFWITLTGTGYGLMKIRSHSTLAATVMHSAYNLTLSFWQGT
jgi:membrane protease YdiL (CAAX protease family)